MSTGPAHPRAPGRPQGHAREATVLIVVIGLSVMMIALTVAFLGRMRRDSEDLRLVTQMAQSRIMLVAACNYIQEAGRLGWDPYAPTAADPNHPPPGGAAPLPAPPGNDREAYGWIDVRDGFMGPRTNEYTAPQIAAFNTAAAAANVSPVLSVPSPNFPIGTAARFPMYVEAQPPFADRMNTTYNPITSDPAKPDFGMPYLRNPDPQPVASSWNTYVTGDPTPVQNSLNLSWFRVYRDGPATFIVTCGAGPSLGFRTWAEMSSSDHDSFGNNQALFDEAVAQDYLTWYRVEWSASVQDEEYHQNVQLRWERDNYTKMIFNVSQKPLSKQTLDHGGIWNDGNVRRWNWGHTHNRNFVGTIKWIQRLKDMPVQW